MGGTWGQGESRRCPVCDKAYYVPPSRLAKGRGSFCSRECSSTGRSTILRCVICDKDFHRQNNAIQDDRNYCSHACYGAGRSKFLAGENATAYIDGRSMKYGSREWKIARAAAKERDGGACQDCGKKEGRIDVHHIREIKEFELRAEADKLENLVTLCRRCHEKRHHKATA